MILTVLGCYSQQDTSLSKYTLKKTLLDLAELDQLKEEYKITIQVLNEKNKQLNNKDQIIYNLNKELDLNNEIQDLNEKIYKEKYNKRFSLGLFIGYGYSMSNDKASPILGVGLNYSLLRF